MLLRWRFLLHSVWKPNFENTPFKDYSEKESIFQRKALLTDKSLILKSINRQYVPKATTQETEVEEKAQYALWYTKYKKTYRFDSVATTKTVQSMFSSKFADIFAHAPLHSVQTREQSRPWRPQLQHIVLQPDLHKFSPVLLSLLICSTPSTVVDFIIWFRRVLGPIKTMRHFFCKCFVFLGLDWLA